MSGAIYSNFLSQKTILNDVTFINCLVRIIQLIHLNFAKNYQPNNE